MSLRELSQRVAVLTALDKKVVRALSDAKAELQAEMQISGADTVSAMIGDVRVAKIPLARREAALRVIDNQAFLEWVRVHRPDEIETVERVRPSSVPALLAVDGDGVIPDGVDYGEPSTYLQVRSVDVAAIEAAWRHGSITPLSWLELGAGDD